MFRYWRVKSVLCATTIITDAKVCSWLCAADDFRIHNTFCVYRYKVNIIIIICNLFAIYYKNNCDCDWKTRYWNARRAWWRGRYLHVNNWYKAYIDNIMVLWLMTTAANRHSSGIGMLYCRSEAFQSFDRSSS